MRFAELRRSLWPRAAAALALGSLPLLAATAGASPAPPRPVGGLTAIVPGTVKVGKKAVKDANHTDPTSKAEFYKLYAGQKITTTDAGRAYFDLKSGTKSLYCFVKPHSPDPGVLTVSPPNGDVMDMDTGTLLCATSEKGGKKTIRVKNVTLQTVDPVFTVVASNQKVVIDLRRGAATVTGSNPKQGIVTGVNTKQSRQKAQQIVVPAGGNPLPPTTVTAPPDKMTTVLENKAPKPTVDTKPPVTRFIDVPTNPSGQTQFPFKFTSDMGALFSCSLNGSPYHACTSGRPQPVGPGQNTLSVKATDPAGNAGPPVSYTWYTERSPSAPIVFQSDRTGRYELYSIDPDGMNLKQLTTTSGFDPAWSPDGKQIAFESDHDQPHGSEIYVLTLADGSIRRLTTNPAHDRTPKWSPDGESIVFASDRNGGKYQLYRMAADGSSGNKPQQLTSGAENTDPSWSTDGESIAFESTRDGNSEIYVMDAAGNNETRVTKNSSGDFNPSWSPDGKQIVFESDRAGNDEIYVMDANGQDQQRLTFNRARDSNPTFSPDGTRIAFSSNRAGPVDIWVARLHAQDVRRVASVGKTNLSPSW